MGSDEYIEGEKYGKFYGTSLAKNVVIHSKSGQ
jgi:hypothetical protein